MTSGRDDFLCWYWRPISVTRLPVLISLAVLALWIVLALVPIILMFVLPTEATNGNQTNSRGITISGTRIEDAGSITISDTELRIEQKTR